MITNASHVTLHNLRLTQSRSWLFAALFIVGNILVPQLCHLAIPQGGLIFLPIYFFTLLGAYKYGWQVGLLTAVLSPVINMLLFSMPAPQVTPIIMIKGVLMVAAASYAASRFKKVSLLILAGVVLTYQVVGSAIESFHTGSLSIGFQDMYIGLPGMLIQVIGIYLVLRYILKK